MTSEEDLDEFDRILVQISSNKMASATTDGMILNMQEIKEIFRRRASRKEIPAKSFIAFL